MNKKEILDVACCIQNNLKLNGLYRYDPNDISSLNIINSNNLISKTLRKAILVVEELLPIYLRKLLKIKKEILPTTYTVLINSYFKIESCSIDFKTIFNSKEIMDMCIEKYIGDKSEYLWWGYPKRNNFFTINKSNNPSMHLHGLARCNIALLTLGIYYNNSRYINIASESVLFVLNNHQIINYQNGSKSISYYYNSYDCTLNVNSEFAHWLSMLPIEKHNYQTLDMLYGILTLLINEQNADGSWYYFSRWHMNKYKNKKSCDCHHSATVLYNLINILKCKYLDEKYRLNIKYSLILGMRYFISAFFDMSSGKGISVIGLKRPAGPVQYSEAIFAFCDYLTLDEVLDLDIQNQIFVLLPKVVDQLCNLVNMKDGSAPSKKVIKWVNLNSIRWGNGPVFQAIMTYLSIYDMVNQDRNEDDGNY